MVPFEHVGVRVHLWKMLRRKKRVEIIDISADGHGGVALLCGPGLVFVVAACKGQTHCQRQQGGGQLFSVFLMGYHAFHKFEFTSNPKTLYRKQQVLSTGIVKNRGMLVACCQVLSESFSVVCSMSFKIPVRTTRGASAYFDADIRLASSAPAKPCRSLL